MGKMPDPVGRLRASPDPTVAYRTRVEVLGEDPCLPELAALRASIASTDRSRRLLQHRRSDGTIAPHPYRKWQGPHWTLVQLALTAYPKGDESLAILRDQMVGWLLEPDHLEFPRSVAYPEQAERFRRCGSQEGNAVWYSVVLGIEDDRTALLVDRLVGWAWPDGGWNCDKRPEARGSSFMETLIPVRGLGLWGRVHGDQRALDAAERAAEFLLQRRLLWRLRDGLPCDPRFLRIHHPIRFYDLLFALQVMAEIGKIGDPRCGDALTLLERKRLPDGGFPAEVMTARTSDEVTSRGSYADWGPGGTRRSNDLVTVDALSVLHAAGRD
jgi:hypothetical protein